MAAQKKPTPVYIGADPEYFVKHVKTGKVTPIIGIVGGTKDSPKQIEYLNSEYRNGSMHKGHFAYQEDGVAFEFNIPAAPRADHASMFIHYTLRTCYEMLSGKGYRPYIVAEHEFEEAQLKDPKAHILGCSADWNAYDHTLPRTPFDAKQFGRKRFCGGHIHVGYDKSKVPAHIMAQFMDAVLGVPSVFLDKQGDRRKYYGLAGLYREKPYGIEYRTLSNFWLRGARDNKRETYKSVIAAAHDLATLAHTRPDVLIAAYGRVPWSDVRKCIENEDKELATSLLDYLANSTQLPYRNAYMLTVTTSAEATE